MKLVNKIINYLLLVFWMILIFYLSNQPGKLSGGNSGHIIYQTLEFIFKLFNIDKSNLNEIVIIIHNPLRELMHAFEYLVLAILFINAFKDYKNKTAITIMFCFIYAATDEIHQLFIPGRSFEYYDILLDTLGSILGTLICKLLSKNNKSLE